VPTNAAPGVAFEVKVLIGHPMETGYRAGANGERLARDIITRFVCSFEDEEVLSIDMSPAIAANPYLAFQVAVPRAGTLTFRWQGDHDFDVVETRRIEAS